MTSQNLRRAQAETNRNSAIEGMFGSAANAIKSGSYSKEFGYSGDELDALYPKDKTV